MALQTAPLGQLPSMNMPYSIPTYDKGPSIWEKALAAFLVNAAGQAAENTFQQENAPRYGEEATPWFKKPLVGARVNERQAAQRDAQAFDEKSQLRGITADANLERFRQSNELARQNAQLNNAFELEGSRQAHDIDLAGMQNRDRAALEDRRLAAESKLAQLREEHKALLEGRDPLRRAQAGYYEAGADEARANTRRMNMFEVGPDGKLMIRGQGQNTPTTGANPVTSDEDRRRREAARQAGNPNALPAGFDWSEVSRAMADTPASQAVMTASGLPPPLMDLLSTLMAQGQGGVELNQPASETVSSPAAAGPLSTYDPVIDPILTWLANLMRNPPGSSPAR